MKQSLTTAERVRELFEYDAELGVLRWRIRQGNRAKVGGIAGTRNKISGRMIVCVYIEAKRKLHDGCTL